MNIQFKNNIFPYVKMKASKSSFKGVLTFDYKGDIFTPEEVDDIKNYDGSFKKKVEKFKNLFLEKYGYSKNLVPHIIRSSKENGLVNHKACFLPIPGKIEIMRQKSSNQDMLVIIGHELRHFMQYANMFKKIGLKNAEEIIRQRTIDALRDKLELNEIEASHINTVEEIISALVSGAQIVNRSFWQKAIDQTPYPDSLNPEFLESTIKSRIKGYCLQSDKPKKINSVYDYLSEKRDYIRVPFENDAYQYQEQIMKSLKEPYVNYFRIEADALEDFEKVFDSVYSDLSPEKRIKLLTKYIDMAVIDLGMYNKELSPKDELVLINKAKDLIIKNNSGNLSLKNPSFKGKKLKVDLSKNIPLVPDTKILNKSDIELIKNLNGDFDEKVSVLKNFFLKKLGYPEDILPHIVEPSLEDDDYIYGGKLNFNSGLLRVCRDENCSNEELAVTIAHEIRHFYQYAKLYKQAGVENVYKINESGNKEWIRQSAEVFVNCLNKNDLWKDADSLNYVRETLRTKRQSLQHINVDFWNKVVSQTDNAPYDYAEFFDTFSNQNKKQRLIDQDSETYNYFKDNRDYMLDPFEKDANDYELILRKQLGIDTSYIDEHLELAKLYDKTEKILDTLPRKEKLRDNEDYFYLMIDEVYKKMNIDLKQELFLETFDEKVKFLNLLYETAKDYKNNNI